MSKCVHIGLHKGQCAQGAEYLPDLALGYLVIDLQEGAIELGSLKTWPIHPGRDSSFYGQSVASSGNLVTIKTDSGDHKDGMFGYVLG